METVTAIRKTVRKVRGRSLLVITAELRIDDPRGLSDCFAITASLYEPHGSWSGEAQERNGREPDAGGCLHDEIAKFAPELAPLITVHLADPDGTPMHALANGWYFYSGDAHANDTRGSFRGRTPRGLTAETLNIPESDLPEGLDHDGFVAFVESLAPIWREQARVARELLESL